MGEVDVVVGSGPRGGWLRRTTWVALASLLGAMLLFSGGEAGAAAGVDPPPPSLSLVKTVGTSADDCSDTDSVNVPSGAQVFYCYTATNTGESELTKHDLDDDKLGQILDQFEYGLGAGQSLSVTASATIF